MAESDIFWQYPPPLAPVPTCLCQYPPSLKISPKNPHLIIVQRLNANTHLFRKICWNWRFAVPDGGLGVAPSARRPVTVSPIRVQGRWRVRRNASAIPGTPYRAEPRPCTSHARCRGWRRGSAAWPWWPNPSCLASGRAQQARSRRGTPRVAQQTVALESAWDHLFPVEQPRLVRLLVQTVHVLTDGLRIGYREAGFAALVSEMTS